MEHSLQQHHSLLDAVEKRQTKGLGQRSSHSRQSCAGQNHTVALILFQHLRRILPDLGKRFLRDRCQIHPKRVYLLALAAQTAAVQHIPRQAAFTACSGGKYAKSLTCQARHVIGGLRNAHDGNGIPLFCQLNARIAKTADDYAVIEVDVAVEIIEDRHLSLQFVQLCCNGGRTGRNLVGTYGSARRTDFLRCPQQPLGDGGGGVRI